MCVRWDETRFFNKIIFRCLLVLALLGSGVSATAQPSPTGAEAAPSPVVVPVEDQHLRDIYAGGVPQTIDDLRAMQNHQQAISQKLIPCTVGVQVGQAMGSGVIVSADGYVLTAGHVVGKPGQEAIFFLEDGRTVKGKTLGMNRGIDSGMMKIEEPGPWPYVELGDSSALKQGQWCIAVGHPGGYQRDRKPVIRLGRIQMVRPNVIFTDCTLIGGDSGGPLFDIEGHLIGINSRIGENITANMHVPSNEYRNTWDRLTQSESWGHMLGEGPYIGLVCDKEADKALVTQVYDGSPAAAADIRVGDVIVKFDGAETPDFPTLVGLVRQKSPGDKVTVELLRGEETLSVELTVGDRSGQ